MAEAVEGTGVHQILEALAVDHARHALYKVVDVGEKAVLFPLLHDGVYHVGAEALDAAQRKAHVAVLIHGKVVGTLVDIGA